MLPLHLVKKGLSRWAGFAVVPLLLLSLGVKVQGAGVETNRVDVIREQIVIEPRPDFSVGIWTDRSAYYEGDYIRVNFRTDRDSFIYIFDTDTEGITRQLFPNYYDQDNFVRGGRTYSIPDNNYSLRVSGPSGQEYLRAVAVPRRYDCLDPYTRFEPGTPFPLYQNGADGLKLELQHFAMPGNVVSSGETQGAVTHRIIVQPPPPPPRPDVYFAEATTSFQVWARRGYYFPGPSWPPVYPIYGAAAEVELRSSPDDARVYVDGHYLGKTKVKARLSYGTHFVRFTKSGYHDWCDWVTITSPRRVKIKAHLEPLSQPRPREHYVPEEEYGKLTKKTQSNSPPVVIQQGIKDTGEDDDEDNVPPTKSGPQPGSERLGGKEDESRKYSPSDRPPNPRLQPKQILAPTPGADVRKGESEPRKAKNAAPTPTPTPTPPGNEDKLQPKTKVK
ncbi:MAG: DUF4384 domain-containing protein [bacterium]